MCVGVLMSVLVCLYMDTVVYRHKFLIAHAEMHRATIACVILISDPRPSSFIQPYISKWCQSCHLVGMSKAYWPFSRQWGNFQKTLRSSYSCWFSFYFSLFSCHDFISLFGRCLPLPLPNVSLFDSDELKIFTMKRRAYLVTRIVAHFPLWSVFSP